MQSHKNLRIVGVIFLNLGMLVALVGTIASFFKPDLLFSETMQLYGPLKNNLVFVLIYICITEIALFFFQFYKIIVYESLGVGLILVLIAFGTQFYSEINQLPFNPTIFAGCIFIAICHIVYYGAYLYAQTIEDQQNSKND